MTPADITAKLNPEQAAAAAHRGSALLILAGAGSGKTRTLTYRIAHLITSGDARAEDILALTFTNKAAREMRERAEQLLGTDARFSGSPVPSLWDRPLLVTFHSFCARLLRAEVRSGTYPDFSVMDTADGTSLFKKIAKELELDTDLYPPAKLRGAISRAKNDGISLETYRAVAAERGDFPKVVTKVWEEYEARKAASNLLDFDDLMLETIALFRDQPDRLEFYRGRFRHVMVDEWQDTNLPQYQLIRLLSPTGTNLVCVGDDDQSIYAFRGAKIENLQKFERDFAGARVIKLEQNYRSTKRILAAANAVIAANPDRRDKKLWTSGETGPPIEILRGYSGDDEARQIARKFVEIRETAGLPWSSFAVLYRTTFLSRELEEAFLSSGIPYRITGGLKFYDRKEIKDLLAYLRLLANPADEASFLRIVNVPARKIGPGTVEKVIELARAEGIGPFQWVMQRFGKAAPSPSGGGLGRGSEGNVSSSSEPESPADDPPPSPLPKGGGTSLPSAATNAIRNFAQIFSELDVEKASPRELLDLLYHRSGYELELEDDPDRQRNVSELLVVAERYDGIPDAVSEFLNDVALVTDTEDTASDDVVTLSTLHAAKGLEWPVVAIVGVEVGLMPHENARDDTERAEERRLMYVGITRAREKLFLSFTTERFFFGSREARDPSPYLRDLPASSVLRTIDEVMNPGRKSGGGYFSQFGRGSGTPEFSDGDGGEWGA